MLRSRCLVPMLAGLVALVFSAAPPAMADDDNPLDVTDTEWVCQDGPSQFIITFRFEKNGQIRYKYNGTTYKVGSWKQEEDKLYFEVNDKYREFEGRVKELTIEGNSWNVKGEKWKTKMLRYSKPEK